MIRINYPVTVGKANDIRDLADKLTKLARDLNNTMSDTQTHWHGIAADAYLKQCGNLMQAMIQTANEMYTIANSIKNVADTILKADQAVASSAQTLKS